MHRNTHSYSYGNANISNGRKGKMLSFLQKLLVKFLENFLKFPLKGVGVGESMTSWQTRGRAEAGRLPRCRLTSVLSIPCI